MIHEYEKFLSSKKLVDALEDQFPDEKYDNIKGYVSEIAVKIEADIKTVTVGHLLKHRRELKDVILHLGSGILNIKHAQDGCLDMLLIMSAHDSFKAYKMTLLNRHKFWNFSIIYVKIGKFPVVYNPIKLKTAIYCKNNGK